MDIHLSGIIARVAPRKAGHMDSILDVSGKPAILQGCSISECLLVECEVMFLKRNNSQTT